jgi:hypothetical protein
MSNYLTRLAARSAGKAAAHSLLPANPARMATGPQGGEDPFEATEMRLQEAPISRTGQVIRAEHTQPQKEDQEASTASAAQATPTAQAVQIPAFMPKRSSSVAVSGQRANLENDGLSRPFLHPAPESSSISYQEGAPDSAAVFGQRESAADPECHEAGRLQRLHQGSTQAAPSAKQGESWPNREQGKPGAAPGEFNNSGLLSNGLPMTERARPLRPFHTEEVVAGTKEIEPTHTAQTGNRNSAVPSMAELLPKEPARLPAPTAPMEQPKLTIGRIVVEVVPAEPVARQPQPSHAMTQSVQPQRDPGAGTRSKLRFGLGQI